MTTTSRTNGAAGHGAAGHGVGGSAALLLGSAISLQLGAAIAMQLFPALGAAGVNALRFIVAAVVMLLIARPSVRRWTRHQWLQIIAFGVAMAGMNGSFYQALERLPLGVAVAIEFLGPLVLAAVLSRRVLDLTCVGIAAVGMALLGIESMQGAEGIDPLGVAWVLLAALFWAFYILTSAKVGAVVPGQGGLAVALVVGAVISAPIGVQGIAVAAGDLRLLLAAMAVAVLASVIPYALEFQALRRLPKSVFGVLTSLEPAVATLAGWVLLGQAAGPLRLTAVGLVIAASAVSAIGSRRLVAAGRPGRPEPTESITLPIIARSGTAAPEGDQLKKNRIRWKKIGAAKQSESSRSMTPP